MKTIFPILALIPSLTTGCVTYRMYSDGFQTVTTPFGASDVPGYRPPQAIKNTNGAVVLEYDAAQYRVGMLGGGTTLSKWHLVRITNEVPAEQLTALTNLHYQNGNLICPPAISDLAFVHAGQALPHLQQAWRDGQLVYPDRECLLNDGGWCWYVPPHQAGDSAKEVILAKDTRKIFRPFVAAKIALTPVTIVPDAIAVSAIVALSPIWVPALMFGGNFDM